MITSRLLARLAVRAARRRLRRAAGTGTVAWALRVPLVTLALAAALLLVAVREGRPPRG
ncbi:hypothetical protein [Miltoncostaea marina]|uniref:hypothetical protein n=1 Tax=Miltoncostaea marina TaxID=2843215 RepID=UPI001FECE918|nr:hypothetical protein [Miltoncostaea marina]